MQIIPLRKKDRSLFKRDMQEAFQKGTEKYFGSMEKIVLPESDIEKSLNTKGATAYEAVMNNEIVGGAIVSIVAKKRFSLDLLYVKHGAQSKGIGKAIWEELENLYPEAEVWETITPYFEKRNIHFYINQCGFHAVEFFNPHHPASDIPDDMVGGDYFFRFEKRMK